MKKISLICIILAITLLSSCFSNETKESSGNGITSGASTDKNGSSETTFPEESITSTIGGNDSNSFVTMRMDEFDSFKFIDISTPDSEHENMLLGDVIDGDYYLLFAGTSNEENSLPMMSSWYVSVFDENGLFIKKWDLPTLDIFGASLFAMRALSDGTLLFIYVVPPSEIKQYTTTGSEGDLLPAPVQDFVFLQVDTDGVIKKQSETFGIEIPTVTNRVEIDAEDNIYFSSVQSLHVLSKDGEIIQAIRSQYFTGVIVNIGGSIFVHSINDQSKGRGQSVFNPIDPKIGVLEEGEIILPLTIDFYQAIGNDDGLLLVKERTIDKYFFSSKETKTIFNYDDSGEGLLQEPSFSIFQGEHLLVSRYNSRTENSILSLVTRSQEKEDENDKNVVIGVIGIQGLSEIALAVDILNEENSEIKYVIKDYTKIDEVVNSGSPETFIMARKQLNLDILSGFGPDVLICDNMLPAESYEKQGLFIDLSSYMNNSESFEISDYFQNALFALETEQGLYRIGSQMILNGLMIPKNKAPSGVNGWTLSEFTQWCEENETEDFPAFSYLDYPYYFCAEMVSHDFDSFIDAKSRKANFQNDKFADILLFVDRYCIREEDNQLLKPSIATRFDSSSLSNYLYSKREKNCGDVKVMGWPNEERSGVSLSLPYTMSVLSDSQYQELGWKLIETVLSEEVQKSMLTTNFHSSILHKNILEKELYAFVYPDEEHKSQIQAYNYFWMNGKAVYPTNEEVMSFVLMLEQAEYRRMAPLDVLVIISDEAQAYFVKQKDAQMTASVIENRVQTWVNEQG